MLLENDFLRQKRQKKQLFVTILVVSFVLFFCFLFLFVNGRESSSFVQGEYYNFVGDLQENNNYPLYTHSMNSGENNYYFRSSSINLNNFIAKEEKDKNNKNNQLSSSIKLGATFQERKNKKDIFEVNFLNDTKNDILYFQKNIIFPSDLLLINTKEDINISAKKEAGKIQIFYKETPAFSIDTFFCNKIVEGYDCEKIRKKLKEKHVDTFRSPLGYDFYKLADTTWYVLDKDNIISYIVSAPDTEMLVDLSYIINFIDKKYISENKKALITEKCLSEGEKLIKIESMKHSVVDTKYFKFDFKLRYSDISDKENQQNWEDTGKLTRSCGVMFDISDLDFWEK